MKVVLSLHICLVAVGAAADGANQNSTVAGSLFIERPTHHSLGFEWNIEGDANANAKGEVVWRKKNTGRWNRGMDLYRIGMGYEKDNSMIGRGWTYTIPDGVAGSILDLEAGTEYEIKMRLVDPDGVSGVFERDLTLSTRPEPSLPAQPVEIRHVYPPSYEGEMQQPAYENIMHAVNGYPPVCDTYQTIHPDAAKPGTVIKMHAGVHTYDNNRYWDDGPAFSYWLHGMITLVANGTEENPIYIVGAGDGEAILDGQNAGIFINVRSSDYLHFEGLTIRNAGISIFGGFQGERGGGTKGLVVKDCWFEDVVTGIMAQDGRSTDFSILDNVFIGRNPMGKINVFGRSTAGYAVNLSGQGHSVGFNYATNFWDGINVFTSALADPKDGQQARSIDIYNNDINNCSDQFIEADGGYANIRVLRNRMFNCPSQPISCQPVHAGPVYFIRNILWNVRNGKGAMKEHSGSQIYVFAHNTTSTHMSSAYLMAPPVDKSNWFVQNNLSLGPTEIDTPLADHIMGDLSDRHIASNNAYREGTANQTVRQNWRKKRIVFDSLAEYQSETGQEANTQLVDFEVFVNAEPPPLISRSTLVYPNAYDLRIKPESSLVDAGARIPGLNDGYEGEAPDIGALENGQPVPVYGPRNTLFPDRLESLRIGKYSVVKVE